jgi:hypothetical protein
MGWGQGGEMTQALYAHMNNKTMKKRKKKKKEVPYSFLFFFIPSCSPLLSFSLSVPNFS